ncbi:MAG TPA: VacJ family lipoprotein [Acidocella sp.]|jgi:phospholipid-binding lipoprotein MlaA|uniref:MlaA family lipoprotein n=1 Tax=Acidocella sp. TaxID=50710 RepID=UPI002C5F8320|nr:VacJ family lipoprotein [Acidocella sp.]HVE21169.1 VacJ family lipoprotein [Acidocella sp.]
MNDQLAARAKQMCRLAAPALFLAIALSGCAHAPPKTDAAGYEAYQAQNDPIEPTNRFFYAVNDRIDRYAFKPVAQGYVAITTQGIRNHVGYFVGNIGEPARMVNFMFEGKSRDAGTSLVRFVLNSTIGIGGIFDPAAALGYKELDTDFGLTLAIWGVPAGPYVYLPVFGPSGARDMLNIPVEFYATPMVLAPESTALNDFGWAQSGLHLINTRAEYLQPIDQIRATALDPYATFRSLYRQSRASQLQEIDRRNVLTPPDWVRRPAAP